MFGYSKLLHGNVWLQSIIAWKCLVTVNYCMVMFGYSLHVLLYCYTHYIIVIDTGTFIQSDVYRWDRWFT